MYVPDMFRNDDPEFLRRHIDANAFAILVSRDEDGIPFASHLPFRRMPDGEGLSRLKAHMARANPQWQHFAQDQDLLVIFPGPHAYVSPQWYKTAPNVPTWNYTAVHVYGRARIVDDAADKKQSMQELVSQFESGFPTPWQMNLPERYEQGMLAGIVSFDVDITRIEGKAKLSQNRKPADRQGAIDGLRHQLDAQSSATADLMQSEN